MSGKKQKRLNKKLSNNLLRLSKEIRQFSKNPLGKTEELPRLLLIIGCQRSGTTLMTQIFEKDWEVQVYPEHSRLSNQDKLDKLRLNPLLEVKDTLSRSRFPLVVLKPLVETQNAQELLRFFQDARALWMFRHYADVANSNLNRFGLHNGIRNLSYIAYNNDSNWRSERVSEAVQDLVDRYFSEDMNPFDAAALFWYIRNSYFFDQQLVAHPRVMMLRYNDLTANPVETMKQIYTHVGQPFPGQQIVSDVHSRSVGKGQTIDLSPEIEDLCEGMLSRLDQVYQLQKNLTLEIIPT